MEKIYSNFSFLVLYLSKQDCVACIRLFCIGPCQVQQRRRSRAQTQKVLYPDHAEGAWMPSVPYALVLRSR